MNEAINFSKEKLEALKQKLASARARIKNIDVNLVKSKINTSKAKVGSFLKTSVKKIKESLGLLPLMAELRIVNLANLWENKRKAFIIKRTEMRRIILSKVDTAKAKVGSFSKKIVNGVKSGVNKIKNVFKQDPEKRATLIEQLKQQKANLISMRDNNKQLREEGSYHNLKGSR